MSENSDDVKDRFAKRFENDESSKNKKTVEKNTQSQKAKSKKKAKKVNIKQAWTNHSVYLDDELAGELARQYKYLDLELDEEFGVSIQKTRHYYPLIVKLGLERLDELDSKDTKEKLEKLTGGEF